MWPIAAIKIQFFLNFTESASSNTQRTIRLFCEDKIYSPLKYAIFNYFFFCNLCQITRQTMYV
jgi:hypothetical protein